VTDLVTDFLARLADAKGEPHALSTFAAEFALAARPKAKQKPLRIALDAAAVLHWFDHGLLVKMLDITDDEARKRFEELKALPFVERYRQGEEDLLNIHESTRLGWRKQFAHKEPKRFAELSAKAAACFFDDFTPAGRIEWIYHLLCGDPERGATELESLDRNWGSCAHPEDLYALAAALRELEDTGLVQGRARVWVLLATTWPRVSRGETAQLSEVVGRTLLLAQAVEDPRAEADAQCLVGDVLRAQGKLEAAQQAFEECLAISQRLAQQDPNNADWQRELAVARSRVGGVLQAQGKLEAAQQAFEDNLAIFQRLAQQDPNNADWQWNLGVASGRVGDMLRAQGKLEAAQQAFEDYLAIFQRLTQQDPNNADWQRELGVASGRVGDVLRAQSKLEAAQQAFEDYLAIFQRLTQQDPNNADWQRELGLASGRVEAVKSQLG
jgi:tetratricopeptide (TPR) repeat protein